VFSYKYFIINAEFIFINKTKKYKMNTYFRKWNFMRMLRLILGIFIIVQGIHAQEWILAVMGALFSLMPVFNIGCCGSSGCSVRVRKRTTENKDIQWEEVKTK
jgi:hypothetical protein